MRIGNVVHSISSVKWWSGLWKNSQVVGFALLNTMIHFCQEAVKLLRFENFVKFLTAETVSGMCA